MSKELCLLWGLHHLTSEEMYMLEFHIQNLCKKRSNLCGGILRSFSTRDIITMITLFKSLPKLDYGSQLWSPHLVKHLDQLEKNSKIIH